MPRALARFVPVVLAATALVCAILFTRSGAGRKNEAQQPAVGTRTTPLVLPTSLDRKALHYQLVKLGLANVLVAKLGWLGGFLVVVPRKDLDQARDAIRDIASHRPLPTGSTCTRVVPGTCDAVQIKPADLRPASAPTPSAPRAASAST